MIARWRRGVIMKDAGRVLNSRGFRRVLLGGMVAVIAALCAPVAKAQLGSNTAQVATITGRVSIERGGELWTMTAGQTIQAGHVIVTGQDGYAQLALSDGSVLEVFPNSRLVFRANRFSWRDLLDLYLGKVRLQIQHLTDDAQPLRVTSPSAVISVRGTVFEVEVDPAQDTIVSVETGAVSVRHRLIPGQEVLVESGQSLRVVAALPLAAAKAAPRVRIIGRVVRAVGDTLAQINATRGSSGGSGSGSGAGGGSIPSPVPGTAPPPSSGPPASDSGSNEPAPPPGEDGPSAPPGDVIP